MVGKKTRVALGIAAVAVVGFLGYTYLYPKIGHASRSEIEAVLPPSLREGEAPDQRATARYRRLLRLTEGFDRTPLNPPRGSSGASTKANERVLGRIEALVSEGPLRKPPRDPKSVFDDLTPVKDAAKLTGLAAEAAWKRGDQAACARWASLGLRYAQALADAGGAAIDGLVGVAIGSITTRTAYQAEIENGLDAAGRARILALLPEGDGSSPALARTMRGEFREFLLPVILDPAGHKDSLVDEFTPMAPATDDSEAPPPPSFFGTFEPVETAREVGRVFDARIADLRRAYPKQTHDDETIAETITRGLPEAPKTSGGEAILDGWPGLRFRMAMNAGRNTLGRAMASSAVFTALGGAAARLDASRNLAHEVILLRMGGSPRVLDPFSGRPLRIDPKRKIVWSVNQDGKDDGGKIGRGGAPMEPDFGFPYGDHSFHPNPNGPFRARRSGMPPPP